MPTPPMFMGLSRLYDPQTDVPIYVGARGSGKTHALVNEARSRGLSIVVANEQEASFINCTSGIPRGPMGVMTAYEASTLYQGYGRRVMVDNAERVLSALLGGASVAGLTATASIQVDQTAEWLRTLLGEANAEIAQLRAQVQVLQAEVAS